MICVHVATAGGGRGQHLAEFQTIVRGLVALRDRLEAHRVTQVAMEATGVYRQPVWHVLEDVAELVLVNSRHIKQVPGRQTDVSDAAWLCRLTAAGLLRGSFVPPKPQRALRTLTRYRKTQIQERQREAYGPALRRHRGVTRPFRGRRAARQHHPRREDPHGRGPRG